MTEFNEAEIARVCHEVNRAYCFSIRDGSQLPWDEAPEWQRESVIAGVKAHLERPLSPDESHALWMEEKLKAGWVYGKAKDAEKKTHPCLVHWDTLPQEQRIKNYLFRAVIDAMQQV